jgi:hypothetical protein
MKQAVIDSRHCKNKCKTEWLWLSDITITPKFNSKILSGKLTARKYFSAITGEQTTIFWSHIYSHLLGFHQMKWNACNKDIFVYIPGSSDRRNKNVFSSPFMCDFSWRVEAAGLMQLLQIVTWVMSFSVWRLCGICKLCITYHRHIFTCVKSWMFAVDK